MINLNAKRKLLLEIKQTDFVLKELNLFLDTHPNSREALEKFYQTEQLAKKLKYEYEKLYGPLTPSTVGNTETWEWIKGPWPWENC
ncbi:MAG: spore coat protein CotJB [Clostridia bacterium]|nr:spore coat protein CotJB [Clostridia bacterium]